MSCAKPCETALYRDPFFSFPLFSFVILIATSNFRQGTHHHDIAHDICQTFESQLGRIASVEWFDLQQVDCIHEMMNVFITDVHKWMNHGEYFVHHHRLTSGHFDKYMRT